MLFEFFSSHPETKAIPFSFTDDLAFPKSLPEKYRLYFGFCPSFQTDLPSFSWSGQVGLGDSFLLTIPHLPSPPSASAIIFMFRPLSPYQPKAPVAAAVERDPRGCFPWSFPPTWDLIFPLGLRSGHDAVKKVFSYISLGMLDFFFYSMKHSPGERCMSYTGIPYFTW